MSLLLETIKVYNNKLINIHYHNERVNRSRYELLGARDIWDIGKLISIPNVLLEDTIYKCRFIYFEDVISVEFQSYSIKKINTLSLSICDEFDYHYKFLNRESFEKLKGLKHIADDIIIVKDNIITDCSYANLVFFNGQEWITPKNPLLLGTKRQKYLDEKKIVEQIITPSELKFFSNLRLINAMIDLEESPDIPIENIL